MLNFSIPSFTLCQEKRYITKGIPPISKTFLLLKYVENRYFVEDFMCAAILFLQWQGEDY